jgi:glycosyltransferase involved in cell wall biosynthesis
MVVGLGLLTFVPGRVGGSETYVREFLGAIAARGRLEYRVFLPERALDVAGGLSARTIASYPASASTLGRGLAMIKTSLAPGRVRAEFLVEPLDVMHYPLTTVLPRVNVPTVVTVHDLYHEVVPALSPLALPRSEVAWRKLTWPRVLRRLPLVVAVSEVVKQSLVERYGIPPEHVRVVHHGVDHARFRPSDKARRPFLLFPAHGWPNKNHDRLLEAFRILRQRHPELGLVLTGRGNERRVVPAGVDVLGYVSADALVHLYQTAAALVFPSLYEGFGQPPLEAMASGCPVAAAASGAIPEICGDAARLFDPWSVESIVEAVEDVLAHGDEFRARGVERAAAFSWERCVREYESVYLELSR